MVLVVCLKEYCLKCYPEVIILIPSLDQSSMTLQERVSELILPDTITNRIRTMFIEILGLPIRPDHNVTTT